MRGDRFKKRLPKFIGRIGDMDDLFYAEDQEFEKIEKLIWDFTYGLYVSQIDKTSNPDFFLSRLERDYGLESAGSVQDRINAILLKMRGKRTTTEEVILEICMAFGFPASYHEKYRDYGYLLELYVNGDLDMDALWKALREVTPAHLWIDMNMNFARAMKLYTRSGDSSYLIYLCGEHPCGDIPYPWATGDIIHMGIKAVTGEYDSRNYYGMTGLGYKAGELRRDEKDVEVRYVQNFNREDVYDFGGDLDAK